MFKGFRSDSWGVFSWVEETELAVTHDVNGTSMRWNSPLAGCGDWSGNSNWSGQSTQEGDPHLVMFRNRTSHYPSRAYHPKLGQKMDSRKCSFLWKSLILWVQWYLNSDAEPHGAVLRIQQGATFSRSHPNTVRDGGARRHAATHDLDTRIPMLKSMEKPSFLAPSMGGFL